MDISYDNVMSIDKVNKYYYKKSKALGAYNELESLLYKWYFYNNNYIIITYVNIFFWNSIQEWLTHLLPDSTVHNVNRSCI